MARPVQIELLPLGKTLTVEQDSLLQDALFTQGVEFPCGGRGRCKGCKVKVLAGALPVTAEDERLLKPDEIAAGWRLSCRAVAKSDLRLELAQWEAAILADNSVFEFEPQDGLGVAVDLGTTTIVAQLLDLRTGHVLAVRTGLNAQARHGADIMSRVEFGSQSDGQTVLEQLVRKQIGGLIEELLSAVPLRAGELRNIVIVGNTVMHHLFCGIGIEPLSRHPFEPERDGLETFSGSQLGWPQAGGATVRFLPCLGGFVGSDILAGVVATQLHESEALVALVDLGTNGEIVVGNRDHMVCASTAAGPAFEGARISMGMRAATGAISEAHVEDGRLRCHVIGNSDPRGVCGSGLVDAVAGALDLGWIKPNGRLAQGESLPLVPPVNLTQWDVRELQLAKGAIAAGIRILAQEWGAGPEDITRLHLAGAFGNYINRASARRIGLIDYPPEKVVPVGNTALLGAKLVLFSPRAEEHEFTHIRSRMRHISLNEVPAFLDTYTDAMGFP